MEELLHKHFAVESLIKPVAEVEEREIDEVTGSIRLEQEKSTLGKPLSRYVMPFTIVSATLIFVVAVGFWWRTNSQGSSQLASKAKLASPIVSTPWAALSTGPVQNQWRTEAQSFLQSQRLDAVRIQQYQVREQRFLFELGQLAGRPPAEADPLARSLETQFVREAMGLIGGANEWEKLLTFRDRYLRKIR